MVVEVPSESFSSQTDGRMQQRASANSPCPWLSHPYRLLHPPSPQIPRVHHSCCFSWSDPRPSPPTASAARRWEHLGSLDVNLLEPTPCFQVFLTRRGDACIFCAQCLSRPRHPGLLSLSQRHLPHLPGPISFFSKVWLIFPGRIKCPSHRHLSLAATKPDFLYGLFTIYNCTYLCVLPSDPLSYSPVSPSPVPEGQVAFHVCVHSFVILQCLLSTY